MFRYISIDYTTTYPYNEKLGVKNKYYNGNNMLKLIIDCCSLVIALLKELIAV